MDIFDYAREQGLILEIHQRKESMELPRYYVQFRGVHIDLENGLLKGAFGDGDTLTQAIYDYCIEISGKCLVVQATRYSKEWRGIAPQLTN